MEECGVIDILAEAVLSSSGGVVGQTCLSLET